MKPSLSFTVKGQGLLRVLTTPCEVCAAFDPTASPSFFPSFQQFTAIWDTGATNSVITQEVIDKCGLKPVGMAQVQGVHGSGASETFLINIRLPNKVMASQVTVTRGDFRDAQVIVGMDIITSGDFSITNVGDLTVFSFRIPSQHTVDFVKQYESQAAVPKYQHQVSGSRRKKKPGKQFGKRK